MSEKITDKDYFNFFKVKNEFVFHRRVLFEKVPKHIETEIVNLISIEQLREILENM